MNSAWNEIHCDLARRHLFLHKTCWIVSTLCSLTGQCDCMQLLACGEYCITIKYDRLILKYFYQQSMFKDYDLQ